MTFLSNISGYKFQPGGASRNDTGKDLCKVFVHLEEVFLNSFLPLLVYGSEQIPYALFCLLNQVCLHLKVLVFSFIFIVPVCTMTIFPWETLQFLDCLTDALKQLLFRPIFSRLISLIIVSSKFLDQRFVVLAHHQNLVDFLTTNFHFPSPGP